MIEHGVLEYGYTNDDALDDSNENFYAPSFNPFSFCCTPIEILSNDGKENILYTASGFFWKHNGQAFLITNWHVLSGRNPFNGKIISEYALIPEIVSFYGFSQEFEGGRVKFSRVTKKLTLDDKFLERIKNPPLIGRGPVDVFAIPIENNTVFGKNESLDWYPGSSSVSCYLNELITDRIATRAGDECYILGYPIQNYTGFNFPIWKKGSISSETNIGVAGRPIFLVDSSTTSSMSGSPILRRISLGAYKDETGSNFEELLRYDFIGIYAGRLENKKLSETNIGYGWYQSLIPKIIRSEWHI